MVGLIHEINLKYHVTLSTRLFESVPGQSVLGVALVRMPSKVPAHSSRFVKKSFRLKSFFTVAGMEECSNCELG